MAVFMIESLKHLLNRSAQKLEHVAMVLLSKKKRELQCKFCNFILGLIGISICCFHCPWVICSHFLISSTAVTEQCQITFSWRLLFIFAMIPLQLQCCVIILKWLHKNMIWIKPSAKWWLKHFSKCKYMSTVSSYNTTPRANTPFLLCVASETEIWRFLNSYWTPAENRQ